MTPHKHVLKLMVFGTLAWAGLCPAQQLPQKRVESPDVPRPAEMVGTKTLTTPGKTTDSIVMLQTVWPQTTNAATVITQGSRTSVSEIASLQLEIKDKQKRVELLMHMFVADERSFLIDPSSPSADQEAVAKRRFEQDELHKESAEISQLQAKLDQLVAAQEHAVAARP